MKRKDIEKAAELNKNIKLVERLSEGARMGYPSQLVNGDFSFEVGATWFRAACTEIVAIYKKELAELGVEE